MDERSERGVLEGVGWMLEGCWVCGRYEREVLEGERGVGWMLDGCWKDERSEREVLEGV